MEEFPLFERVLNTYNSSWETMCILIGQTHNSLQKYLQSCVTSTTFALHKSMAVGICKNTLSLVQQAR